MARPRYWLFLDGKSSPFANAVDVEVVDVSDGQRLTFTDLEFLGDPEILGTGLDEKQVIDMMTPSIAIANELRERLLDLGWTPEAAEDIAGEIIINLIDSIGKES